MVLLLWDVLLPDAEVLRPPFSFFGKPFIKSGFHWNRNGFHVSGRMWILLCIFHHLVNSVVERYDPPVVSFRLSLLQFEHVFGGFGAGLADLFLEHFELFGGHVFAGGFLGLPRFESSLVFPDVALLHKLLLLENTSKMFR